MTYEGTDSKQQNLSMIVETRFTDKCENPEATNFGMNTKTNMCRKRQHE